MKAVPAGALPLALLFPLCLLSSGSTQEEKGSGPPDIRTVAPDLEVPVMTPDREPAAGLRVKATLPGRDAESLYHALYLPPEWDPNPGGRWPVVVELPGNGGFRSRLGDVCTGLPEGCKLGFGITGGTGAIWVAAPFVDASGEEIAVTWWGDPPAYDPEPSVEYLRELVRNVCDHYGGDPERVSLCGFSRGALACHVIGLHDEDIAGLWRGLLCYSHYDGVRENWPYPKSDRAAARDRLLRRGDTPEFICHESGARPHVSLAAVRAYLEGTGVEGEVTFSETGFRNHNDAWILRPSPARERLRAWYAALIGKD